MRLCGKCRKKPWPYALVLFISTFVGFVTWLTMSAVGLAPAVTNGVTIGAFLIAAVVLFSYMISCMRRHCADDQHVA
jgi:hypothetical protein